MKFPGLYTLQSKFILGLISVIMIVSIINLTALYFVMQHTMQNEVTTRAKIILEQVDAVKGYVQATLRPKMFDVLPDNFILEAMSSSFISRKVMENIGGSRRDYLYRRIAINATNPAFEASVPEQEIIDHFRENTQDILWEGTKVLDGKEFYVMARPVIYTADCLLCHGNPKDAPEAMSAQYGSTGYFHNEDSIDGIDLVGVNTLHYTARNNTEFMNYAVIYITISCLILFLIYLTFQRVVVVNLRTLTKHFRKNFSDQRGVELLKKVEHGDEIEEMVEGMEGLSHHLYETERQLKQYTANLEKEVAKRTEQLSQENEKRHRDFALFVNLLKALKNSKNRADLWQNVLPLLVKSLQLQKASYICTFASNQSFTWPPEEKEPKLPADHLSILLDPKIRILNNEVYIPVGASDDDIEGLLYLVRDRTSPFVDDEREQLAAVGRQLGIAAENMAALDSILRQSDNLQTIFEGITDPLILLERPGGIIMANNAATRLMETFSDNENTRNFADNLLAYSGNHSSDTSTEDISRSESREIILDNDRSFIVNTFPLQKENHYGQRIVVAIQENTEKKKMLRQVVQSEKMATVGKLAAGLAHELNNPLGVILCYAELIKKGLPEEHHQADIDIIIKHTKQAQSVLLNLLNFARPKVATSKETILGDIVESVISVFQVQASKKGVTLTCRRKDNSSPVRVEQQAVEHIMLNLLINALDAIETDNGKIEVGVALERETKHVILTVEDSGSGIPEELLPHIFDPFFTTKDINEGTGLGLAVIYGYMYELGGTIEAANKTGGGTVFTLKFPAADKTEKHC